MRVFSLNAVLVRNTEIVYLNTKIKVRLCWPFLLTSQNVKVDS
jgi:hypothetical protein